MARPPTSPGWYPDRRDSGLERWWNGLSWSSDTRPASGAAGLVGAGADAGWGTSPLANRASRRSPRRLRTRVLLPLLVVEVAILVVTFQRARNASVAPVLRDYVVFTLSDQQPVAGHVWGPECRPLLIHVPAQIDDAMYAQFAFVVAEADSHGLPVSLTRSYSFTNPPPPAYPLKPPPYEAVPPGGVWFVADAGVPPRAPDGHPYRFGFGPVHSAVDGQQVVRYDVDTIHTQSFDAESPLFWRQAMRVMIGYGWLIDRSTDPSSGLAVDDANDAFTTRDVAALGYLSGCATH